MISERDCPVESAVNKFVHRTFNRTIPFRVTMCHWCAIVGVRSTRNVVGRMGTGTKAGELYSIGGDSRK